MFEKHPMRLPSTQFEGIPLTNFMDSETENVVKSLNFLYNRIKSDGNNLEFLDTTLGKKEYKNCFDTIAYSLNENGDVVKTVVDTIIIKEE